MTETPAVPDKGETVLPLLKDTLKMVVGWLIASVLLWVFGLNELLEQDWLPQKEPAKTAVLALFGVIPYILLYHAYTFLVPRLGILKQFLSAFVAAVMISMLFMLSNMYSRQKDVLNHPLWNNLSSRIDAQSTLIEDIIRRIDFLEVAKIDESKKIKILAQIARLEGRKTELIIMANKISAMKADIERQRQLILKQTPGFDPKIQLYPMGEQLVIAQSLVRQKLQEIVGSREISLEELGNPGPIVDKAIESLLKQFEDGSVPHQ